MDLLVDISLNVKLRITILIRCLIVVNDKLKNPLPNTNPEAISRKEIGKSSCHKKRMFGFIVQTIFD